MNFHFSRFTKYSCFLCLFQIMSVKYWLKVDNSPLEGGQGDVFLGGQGDVFLQIPPWKGARGFFLGGPGDVFLNPPRGRCLSRGPGGCLPFQPYQIVFSSSEIVLSNTLNTSFMCFLISISLNLSTHIPRFSNFSCLFIS